MLATGSDMIGKYEARIQNPATVSRKNGPGGKAASGCELRLATNKPGLNMTKKSVFRYSQSNINTEKNSSGIVRLGGVVVCWLVVFAWCINCNLALINQFAPGGSVYSVISTRLYPVITYHHIPRGAELDAEMISVICIIGTHSCYLLI